MMRYRSANEAVFSAKYHVVWCPKYREVCVERDVTVIELEVLPDRVYLLVEVPPAAPLSGFVQAVKGRSSRLLRAEFPHLRRLPCWWSPSWFISTVGGARLRVVRRYVENQKQAA
jgi:REP-associated tyrosine transposase